ncbi:MAG: hypothetical protein ABWY57_15900 [Mycetocola sp.]
MSTVNIHCQFTPGEYRVLEGMAKRMDTQVHVLIEKSIRKALNGYTPPPVPKKPATPAQRVKKFRGPELATQVRALNESGLNDREISDHLGIPYSTAHSVRSRLGLPTRTNVGRPKKNTTPTEGEAA